MKKPWSILAVMTCVVIQSQAATYYSQGDLDPTLTASWNSNRVGGGTSPSNFSSGDVFVIQALHEMITGSAWSLSGTNAKLWIENGGALTATSAVTLSSVTTFQIDDGGRYIHDNTAAFGSSIFQGNETFSAGSSVELKNSNATGPSNIVFGNLVINLINVSANTNFSGGITTINGNLEIRSTNGFELRWSTNTSFSLTITGNLDISGGTLNTSNGSTAGRSFIINLGGDFIQTGGTLTHTNSASGCQLNFNFTGANKSFTRTAGTLTNSNINWAVNPGASLTLNSDLGVASSRTMTIGGNLTLASDLSINGDLVLDAGSLSIGNHTLTLNGATSVNSGRLEGSNESNMVLGGNAAQALFFSTNASLNNLTLNKPGGTATLGTALNIYGVIAWTAVGGTLALGNNNLVLKSVSGSTARVAAVPSGKLTGATNITVERFIPARRAWRILATPLTSTGSIFNTWQNGGVYTSATGTFITGPSANLLTNGLDASNQNTTSLYRYDQATNAWMPITNTRTSALSDQSAHLVFIRGDRHTNNLSQGNSNVTTLHANGALRTGDQQFITNSTTNGFTLIGNPFASPIDFNAAYIDATNAGIEGNTNVLRKFWTWDPTIGDRGAYVVVSHNGTSYDIVPTSNQTQHIQSGQAFFVQSDDDGTAQFTIKETHKSASSTNNVFRTSASQPKISISLHRKTNTGAYVLTDGAQVNLYQNHSATTDKMDAKKFPAFDETLSVKSEGLLLSIDARPYRTRDTIFLDIGNLKTGNYSLKVGNTLDGYKASYLEDAFRNVRTILGSSETTIIEFETSAEAASRSSDRFRLILNMDTSVNALEARMLVYPNPVTGISFQLKVAGIEPGNYQITIFDLLGKTVFEKPLSVPSYFTERITFPNKLPTGLYRLELSGKARRLWKTFIALP